MMIKLITRISAGIAATVVAALPLTIGTSAHAINKHEGGHSGDVVAITAAEPGIDAVQMTTGALAGATVTGAAFMAYGRFGHRDSA